MADFAALATRYVLADDDAEQRQLAKTAADGISNAPRKSAAVLSWAQSVNPWMPGGSSAGDDDVIVRAKALGFLAATLDVLDRDVLRAEQLEHLVAFFGAMFAVDHKAGILAAASALRCLCAMAAFRPSLASAVLAHVCKLADDDAFRLQTPDTRRAIYDLVAYLVRNDAVIAHLQNTQGAACTFLVDLLHLCRSERDPDNLLRWFAIMRRVLTTYTDPRPNPDVVDAVFKAASDYFPISMRSAATPAGTTVEDLKIALRGCLSACTACDSAAAAAVLTFLLQKLDQGDALTLSVKVDILQTIHACVEAASPAVLAPHAAPIWNVLKFEVRHGDVPETINATLGVVEAITTKLDEAASLSSTEPTNALKDFVGIVLADCIGDLANSTFTRSAGQLLNSAARGGLRAFHLSLPTTLAAIQKDLLQRPQHGSASLSSSSSATSMQTANHTRDLLAVLTSILQTRQALVEATTDANTPDDASALAAFHSHDTAILGLLDSVYLRLWTAPSSSTLQDPVVRTEVIRGLSALVVQRVSPTTDSPTSSRMLLCSPENCTTIVDTLAPLVLLTGPIDSAMATDSDNDATAVASLAHHAMLALQTTTSVFPQGFTLLVDKAVAVIDEINSGKTSASLDTLRDTLARLAYIGCAALPAPAASSVSVRPLSLFSTLTQALCMTLDQILDANASSAASSSAPLSFYSTFQTANTVLVGIYAAVLNVRDAFSQADIGPQDALFQAYHADAVTLVRRLYRRATIPSAVTEGERQFELGLSADFGNSSSSGQDEEAEDTYLHQLASLATFVLRDMDEAQQKEARLHEAAFWLFHTANDGTTVQPRSFFHGRQGGRIDVLSQGLFKALWPGVVALIPLSPRNLLEDLHTLDTLPPRTRLVRNTIATIVANKYSAAATSPISRNPDNQAAWKATVEAVHTLLGEGTTTSTATALSPHMFARLIAIAAGAFARLDKDARVLAEPLAFAPAKQPQVARGLQMARLLGGLLVAPSVIGTPAADHAVVKALSRQWVYAQTAKALLPRALPERGAVQDGANNSSSSAAADVRRILTAAILALVRNVPSSVYEEDVDSGALVRLLVIVVGGTGDDRPVSGAGTPGTKAAASSPDTAVALRVLAAILASGRADALRSHLKTIVDGCVRAFSGAASASASARKAGLRLVAQLPTHYEPGLLLPYEPRLARALAAACGDRVREIREVAQQARASWNSLAT